jgi:adenosine deaminase
MSAISTAQLLQKIVSMPKVELHRHLAGSISPATLLQLHLRYGVELPAVTVDRLRELAVLDRPMKSLQEVLARFDLFARVCTSPEVVEYLAIRAVADAAREGVRYLELRFSPGFMAFRHGLALEAVVEAVVKGSQEAAREHGVIVPLIAIASREMGPQVCRNTFALAARYQPWIVGVDLAGDEDNHPPEQFVEAFEFAMDKGLRATVHAGEQNHAENVRIAVERLHASRIGHGIRIIDHPDIMELLAERNVPLEISITSNYIVGAVPSLEAHPVCALRKAGVPITINSDDPALFGIDLSGELSIYARICNRTLGDLVEDQLATLDYGFAPEADKGIFRQQLHDWWNRV